MAGHTLATSRSSSDDALLPFTELAAGNFCPRTLRNWASRGIKGTKLKHIRVAGRLFGRRSDLAEFLVKCAQAR